MTMIWLVVWFVADHVGDRAALAVDPANWWTTSLLAAIAVDLSGRHATTIVRRGPRD